MNKQKIQNIFLGMLEKIKQKPVTLAVESSGNLLEDYGLESLHAVRLMAMIEEEFQLFFGLDPEDMNALVSLSALVDWVYTKLESAA